MADITLPPHSAGEGPLVGFLARVSMFCATTQRQETALSRALFGDSRRIGQLRGSSDIGVRRLAEAEADLARLAVEAGITLPETPAAHESEPPAARPRAAGEAA